MVLGLVMRVEGPRFWRAGEGQVRVRARHPPRFSYDKACGMRVLGLGVQGECPRFSSAGGGS